MAAKQVLEVLRCFNYFDASMFVISLETTGLHRSAASAHTVANSLPDSFQCPLSTCHCVCSPALCQHTFASTASLLLLATPSSPSNPCFELFAFATWVATHAIAMPFLCSYAQASPHSLSLLHAGPTSSPAFPASFRLALSSSHCWGASRTLCLARPVDRRMLSSCQPFLRLHLSAFLYFHVVRAVWTQALAAGHIPLLSAESAQAPREKGL